MLPYLTAKGQHFCFHVMQDIYNLWPVHIQIFIFETNGPDVPMCQSQKWKCKMRGNRKTVGSLSRSPLVNKTVNMTTTEMKAIQKLRYFERTPLTCCIYTMCVQWCLTGKILFSHSLNISVRAKMSPNQPNWKARTYNVVTTDLIIH